MSRPSDAVADRKPEKPEAPTLLRIERALMALAMVALCVITMANVVVRYLTDESFAYTEEVSVWLLVFLTLVGTSSAFFTKRHISVVILVERLPRNIQRTAGLLAILATAVMFALLVWYGGRMAWDDFRYEVSSPALGIPQWIYTVWLPLLSLLIVGRVAQLAVRHLRGRE
ncbi:MAG: TRAP transporter small permease [Burkholderiales bacterium]|nr:TRAP transporter small permease [Burkholderiales bacterium]